MDLLKLTKKEIIEHAKGLSDRVAEGEVDCMEEISIASKGLLYHKTLIDELKTYALDEIYKYNEKEETVFHGIQFKRTSTATQYNFKSNQEFEQLDNELKELKKVLTTASKTGNAQLVEGVIYEPVPISKQSQENISLTIR